MARFVGDGETLIVKRRLSVTGVGNLNAEIGCGHRSDLNSPGGALRQLFTGVDGIFQCICKHGGKLRLVHRQFRSQGHADLHLNIPVSRQLLIIGQQRVEYRAFAVVIQGGVVQLCIRFTQLLQCAGSVAPFQHGSQRVQGEAHIVAVKSDLFLAAGHHVLLAAQSRHLGLQ